MINVIFPLRKEYLQAFLDFVQSLFREHNFNEKEQGIFRLIAEEVCLFVKETIFLNDEYKDINISLTITESEVSFSFSMKGIPIEFEKIKDYSFDVESFDFKQEELCLMLAKKYMDKFVFINHGRNGMEIIVSKTNKDSRINNIIGVESKNIPNVIFSELPEYEIRTPSESEFIEISRSAYFTYGNTYEDYIYYPQKISQMQKDGELLSLIAVSKDNKVMGHIALKFNKKTDKFAELGVLFVNPEYRKKGLANVLVKSIINKAKDMNLNSIYARSVTGHPASQRVFCENGFFDIGLLLDLFPAKVDLKGMNDTDAEKMSGLLQCLPLKKPRLRYLSIPKRYSLVVQYLYEKINVAYEEIILTQKQTNTPYIIAQKNELFNIGTIEIRNLGSSFEECQKLVDYNIRRLLSDKLDVIYLFINIEETGADKLIDYYAEKDFLFSAILPDGFNDSDVLILQYLNLSKNPFASMKVYSDTSQFLIKTIEKEWEQLQL